jgi:hypothetical protein
MVSFQGAAGVFPRVDSMVSQGRLWVALVPLLFAAACSHRKLPLWQLLSWANCTRQ